MVWADIISGDNRITPQQIANGFKVLAIMQAVTFLFHFADIYPKGRLDKSAWHWKGTITFARNEPNALFESKNEFLNNVEVLPRTANVVFSFSSFREWFNIYTVSFFVFDVLKYLICILIPWQIAKAIADKSDFWSLSHVHRKPRWYSKKEEDALLNKNAFKGFSTEGVKHLRRAAVLLPLIPFLNFLTKSIFIGYASTQSSYPQLGKYFEREDSWMMVDWYYYVHISIILFGIAAIFQYGKQLKEETELTV